MPGRLPHRRGMTPDAVSTNPYWPEGFAALLADYERHLTAERDLSRHSVRAYIGDVADLLEHLIRLGHDDLESLDIRGLRSWLAKQQSLGKARSTMSRRATAARVFTAWAQRTGRISTDPGALLASPRPHKTLPGVLGQADTRAVLDAAAVAADDGSPVGLRDLAIMELLYATGIRVGELCALDIDDIDTLASRRPRLRQGTQGTLRPVRRARGRSSPEMAGRGATGGGATRERPGCLPGRSRRPDRPASGTTSRPRADRGRRRAGPVAARAPAHGRYPSARRWCRPSQCPGTARARVAGDHADLHPHLDRPAPQGLRAGPSSSLIRGRDGVWMRRGGRAMGQTAGHAGFGEV